MPQSRHEQLGGAVGRQFGRVAPRRGLGGGADACRRPRPPADAAAARARSGRRSCGLGVAAAACTRSPSCACAAATGWAASAAVVARQAGRRRHRRPHGRRWPRPPRSLEVVAVLLFAAVHLSVAPARARRPRAGRAASLVDGAWPRSWLVWRAGGRAPPCWSPSCSSPACSSWSLAQAQAAGATVGVGHAAQLGPRHHRRAGRHGDRRPRGHPRGARRPAASRSR